MALGLPLGIPFKHALGSLPPAGFDAWLNGGLKVLTEQTVKDRVIVSPIADVLYQKNNAIRFNNGAVREQYADLGTPANYQFGTDDFTIEMDFTMVASNPSWSGILNQFDGNAGAPKDGFYFWHDSTTNTVYWEWVDSSNVHYINYGPVNDFPAPGTRVVYKIQKIDTKFYLFKDGNSQTWSVEDLTWADGEIQSNNSQINIAGYLWSTGVNSEFDSIFYSVKITNDTNPTDALTNGEYVFAEGNTEFIFDRLNGNNGLLDTGTGSLSDMRIVDDAAPAWNQKLGHTPALVATEALQQYVELPTVEIGDTVEIHIGNWNSYQRWIGTLQAYGNEKEFFTFECAGFGNTKGYSFFYGGGSINDPNDVGVPEHLWAQNYTGYNTFKMESVSATLAKCYRNGIYIGDIDTVSQGKAAYAPDVAKFGPFSYRGDETLNPFTDAEVAWVKYYRAGSLLHHFIPAPDADAFLDIVNDVEYPVLIVAVQTVVDVYRIPAHDDGVLDASGGPVQRLKGKLHNGSESTILWPALVGNLSSQELTWQQVLANIDARVVTDEWQASRDDARNLIDYLYYDPELVDTPPDTDYTDLIAFLDGRHS